MAYTLKEVDYDPFERESDPYVDANVKLTPVDFDPFAGPAQASPQMGETSQRLGLRPAEPIAPQQAPAPKFGLGRSMMIAADEIMGGIGDSLKGRSAYYEHTPAANIPIPGVNPLAMGSGEMELMSEDYYGDGVKDVLSKAYKELGESKAFQRNPELSQRPEGTVGKFAEDVIGGVSGFIPSMGLQAVNPAAGTLQMYHQLVGSQYDQFVKDGVDPDRAYIASALSSLAQVPLESAGNIVTINAITRLGKGKLSQFIIGLTQSMVGEGIEEYLQSYPEEIANIYAANPDVEPDVLAKRVKERLTSKDFQKSSGYQAAVGAGGGALMVGGSQAVKSTYDLAKYMTTEQRKINDKRVKDKKKNAPVDILDSELNDLLGEEIENEVLEEAGINRDALTSKEKNKTFDVQPSNEGLPLANEQTQLGVMPPSEYFQPSAEASAQTFMEQPTQAPAADSAAVFESEGDSITRAARERQGIIDRTYLPAEQELDQIAFQKSQEQKRSGLIPPEEVTAPVIETVEAPVLPVTKPGLKTPEEITAAANEAATSPLNDKPEPTEAQKEAGNYSKGHIKVNGLDISIENPEGSERSGTDENGKPWSVTLQNHYGYIRSLNPSSSSKGLGQSAIGYSNLLSDSSYADSISKKGVDPVKVIDDLISGIRKVNPSKPKNLSNTGGIDTEFSSDAFATNSGRNKLKGLVNIPSDMPGGSVDSIINQAASNWRVADSKLFGNFRNAEAIRLKGYNSISINRQRVVKGHMLSALHDPKIFKSVVELVPVDVMNVFFGEEVSADSLLDNQPMFLDRLSSSFEDPVKVGRFIDAVSSSLPHAFALRIAKEVFALSDSTGASNKGGAAPITKNDSHKTSPSSYVSTKGNDGDHIDVIIGPEIESQENVYIVDQVNPKTGEFDEHKVLMGFPNKITARKAYLSNYEKGWKGLGDITEMPIEDFKAWLGDGERKADPVGTAVAKPKEPKAPNAKQRVAGIDAIVDQVNRIDGVDYELYRAESADDKRAVVRVFDADSGKAVSTKTYPTYEAAKAEYDKSVGALKKEPAAPAVEAPKGSMTLLEARNLLIELRTKESEQGKVVDDRLLEKIRQVEKTVKELEAEDKAPKEKTREQFRKELERTGVSKVGGKTVSVQFNNDTNTYYIRTVEDGVRYEKGPGGPAKWTLGEARAKAEMEAFGPEIKQESTKRAPTVEGNKDLLSVTPDERYTALKDRFPDLSATDRKKLAMDIRRFYEATENLGTYTNINVPSLAEIFLNDIREGKTFPNKVELQRAVAEMFGISRSEMVRDRGYSHKPVEEAFEYATVKRAREVIAEGKSVDDTYAELKALYESQPNLATRTSTSVENQAYSTPVHLAYLMQVAANANNKKTAYEPTAGTGMLLTAFNPKNILANEIGETRVKILEDQGIITFNLDGQTAVGYAGGGSPVQKTVDVVMANPPFGTIKKIVVDGYNITKLEHAIVANALDAMVDDGRAAFIIGGENFKNGTMTGTDKVFFNWLYSHYNVTSNTDIPGSEYGRQGASFPVRVITVNGRKKTPKGIAPETKNDYNEVESIDDLLPLMKELSNAKTPMDSQDTGTVSDSQEGFGGTRPAGQGNDSGTLPGTLPGETSQGNQDIPRPDRGNQASPGGTGGTLAAGQSGPGNNPGINAGSGGIHAGPGNVSIPEGEIQPSTSQGQSVQGGRAGHRAGEQPGVQEGTEQPESLGTAGDNTTDSIEDELASMSEDDIDNLFADVASSLDLEEITPQPQSLGEGSPKIKDIPLKIPKVSAQELSRDPRDVGRWLEDRSRLYQPKRRNTSTSTSSKTPKEAISKAGNSLKNAITSGFNALDALFGSPNTLRSGFAFDEDSYQQAKPHFQNMFNSIKEAGGHMKDFVKLVFERYGTRVQPYLKRFAMDTQAEQNKKETKVEETSYQSIYRPKSKGPIIDETLIPVKMKESTEKALDTLEKDVGDIDEYVAGKIGKTVPKLHKALSADQIDAVALGIYNIDKGAAVVVGDQTGVGKGRIAAALWKYAKTKGKKPVFFTAQPTLFSDFYRDILDIGHNFNPMLMTSKPKDGTIVDGQGQEVFKPLAKSKRDSVYRDMISEGQQGLGEYDGVLTTYSQINVPNIQQEALAPTFNDNIVILDESHLASGPESNTGMFIRQNLQNVEGAIYLSATFAKRPETMPVYYKTDISRANMDMDSLISAVEAGGTPLQEWLTMSLAKVGQYVRREKSFKGIDVRTSIDSKNRQRDEQRSDRMTTIMRNILFIDTQVAEAFKRAVARAKSRPGNHQEVWGVPIEGATVVEGNRLSTTVSRANFAATAHNAVRQLLLSMKADAAIENAIQDIEERSHIEELPGGGYGVINEDGRVIFPDGNGKPIKMTKEEAEMSVAPKGRKPFLALDNTMGSFVRKLVDDGDLVVGDEFNISYSAVLKRNLDRTLRVTVKNPMGNQETHQINVNHPDFPEPLKRAYDDAIRRIDQDASGLPGSPIDYIKAGLKKAGYTAEEITGRDLRADISDPDNWILRRTAKEQDDNRKSKVAAETEPLFVPDKKKILKSYNDGKIDCLIVNRSGSTGVSAHATPKTGTDIRPRSFLSVQAQLNIDDEIQLMGRINRKGQVKLPKFTTLYADVPAEIRPASVLMTKMKSLSANTSANSDSPLSQKTLPDMNNRYGNRVVGTWLNNHPEIRDQLNVTSDDGFIKVSGKIAMQPVNVQRDFFEEVELEYRLLIEDLIEQGQYDLETQDIDFKAITEEKEITTQGVDESHPLGQSTYRETISVVNPTKPYKKARVETLIQDNLKGKTPREFSTDLAKEITDETTKYIEEKHQAAEENNQQFNDAGVRTALDAAQQYLRRNDIGDTYHVSLPNIPTMTGVLIDIKHAKSNAGNPSALSRIRFVFAVNNALRRVNIPLSQVVTGEAHMGYYDSGIIDNWDDISGREVRTDRYMFTGNLLQAAAQAPAASRFVRYTTEGGGPLKEGILAPLNYEPALDSDRVTVTPDKAYDILMDGAPLVGSVVSINTGKIISVPVSKSSGGDYFLDSRLRSFTRNGDFESVGGQMRAHLKDSEADIRGAIERIYQIGDTFSVDRSVYNDANNEGDAPQYSTRTAPGSSVTLKDIQGIFKGYPAGISARDKSIWVKLPAGTIRIKMVQQISEDKAAFEVAYGRKRSNGELIAGKYQNGTIEIQMDIGDKFTVLHELEHWAEDIGLLSRGEVGALNRAIRKEGNEATAENRAKWVEENLYSREIDRKTRLGRILQKIEDFIDSLVNLFHQTTGATLRAFESGKVFGREVGESRTVGEAYDKTAGIWRSQMTDFLKAKLPGSGTPESLKQTIEAWAKKGEYKQEELEWSGLSEWLDSQSGKVTKQDTIDFLEANRVEIQEVVKKELSDRWGVYDGNMVATSFDNEKDAIQYARETGRNEDSVRPIKNSMLAGNNTPKFSKYVTPGGENYKEILLTLPVDMRLKELDDALQNGTARPEDREERLRREKEAYRSSHFEEPNILAHVRFNERTGPNGERILHLEEVQSDWHQEGRKKGYKQIAYEYKIKDNPSRGTWDVLDHNGNRLDSYASKEEAQRVVDSSKKIIEGAPDAPFKKSWPLLAFKRMVRYASENGFDMISWTPGEVQAERYDLSKHIKAVNAEKTKKGDWKLEVIPHSGGRMDTQYVEESELEATVGKELAEKIITQKGGMFSGLDLKVGGEGMKGFYDRILPAEVNKFFGKKAWGNAKVGTVEIQTASDTPMFGNDAVYDKVWGLPITPEMKRKALYEGMPLFKQADATDAGNKIASKFNEQYPGFNVKYDGVQDMSPLNRPDLYQFTIYGEGIAKGATFLSKTMTVEGVKDRVDEMVSLREKPPQYSIREILDGETPGNIVISENIDMGKFERQETPPQWLAKKYKEVNMMFKRQQERDKDRTRMLSKTLEETADFYKMRKGSDEFQQLNALIWKLEGNQIKELPKKFYKDDDGDYHLNEHHYEAYREWLDKIKSLSQPVKDAYLDIRMSLDKDLATVHNTMKEMEDIDETVLEEFRRSIGSIHNYFPHMRYGNYFFQAYNFNMRKTGDMWEAVLNGQVIASGQNQQDVVKEAEKNEDSKVIYREHFDSKGPHVRKANALIKKLQASGELGTSAGIRIGPVTKMPEEVFAIPVPIEAVEAVMNAAINRLESEEAKSSFRDLLPKAVSEALKSRGWGSHTIQRKGTPGHDTKDVQRVLFDYKAGLYGWLTKMEAARDFSLMMAQTQSQSKPQLWSWMKKYSYDMLANSDEIDRKVNNLKAILFAKYLGGNVKTAVLNTTQIIIAGWPRLGMEMGFAFGKVLRGANADIVAHLTGERNLSKDEIKLLTEMFDEGTVGAQFLSEVRSKIGENAFSVGNKYIMRGLGLPMEITERFNRVSMALAAFRGAKNGKINNKKTLEKFGMSGGASFNYDKAKEFASEIVEDTNFVYGKSNRPEALRGGTVNKLLSAAYTFRSFTHHLLHLWKFMFNQGGRGKIAVAKSIGATIAIGGLSSIPLYKTFMNIIRQLTGDDPEEEILSLLPEDADMLRDMVVYGIPSISGFSLGGSIGMELPIFEKLSLKDSFVDQLGNNLIEIIGVPWALFADIGHAITSYNSGNKLRALEYLSPAGVANILKAQRLYDKGSFTLSGRPINVPGSEGPQKLTFGEAFGKAVGFQPTKLTKSWDINQALEDFQAYKTSKRSEFATKILNSQGDQKKLKKIENDLKLWNKENMDRPEYQITPDEIIDSIIARSRTRKPPKYMFGKTHELRKRYFQEAP